MTDETLSIDLTIAMDDPLSPRLVVTLCGDVGQGAYVLSEASLPIANLASQIERLADIERLGPKFGKNRK